MGNKSRQKKGNRNLEKPIAAPATEHIPFWMTSAVALVAVLAIIRTLPYEFVYDDTYQILKNSWIRDWSNLGRFFSTNVWEFIGSSASSNYYRPLQMVLYTAAYSLGGLKPHAYHLFNILLHALCSGCVVWIGFRLRGSRLVSVAAGLLFALHPIHAESLAWVAGVTDPLCAVFYFAALYFYLEDSGSRKNRIGFILAAVFFACALFSKEMAFTFPLVAVWLDWCLHKKLRWPRYAVFVGIFGFYAILRILALHAFAVRQLSVELDPVSRVLSTIVLLAQYMAKMFVPYGISAFHVFQPTTSILSPAFALSLIFLAGLIAATWMLRKQRVMAFLLGFCFLTVIPVLNLTGIGENVFADRYLYIPTLGSCLLIPLTVKSLVEAWGARPPWLDCKVGMTSAGLLLAVFGWMLWHETAVWRDNPTLYLETLKRSPGASSMAHNLAGYYYDTDHLPQAEEWEEKALAGWRKSFTKNKKDLARIYSGFGNIRFKQGRSPEAREYYMKAYREAPDFDELLQNIGIFYVGMREYEKALELFQSAVRLNPSREVAYCNIAGIYAMYGKWDQAIANAQRALSLVPGYGDAWANLAYAYASKGMKEEARQAYLTLKRIDPSKSSLADDGLKSLGMR